MGELSPENHLLVKINSMLPDTLLNLNKLTGKLKIE